MEVVDGSRYLATIRLEEIVEYTLATSKAIDLDPSKITIHLKEPAGDGSPAYAIGRSVFVDHTLLVGTHSLSTRWKEVLAHELVHVRQFENGQSSLIYASDAQLEAEAEAGGQALSEGNSFKCELSSDLKPMFWNRFGHYYSTYFIALAAGVPPEKARSIALYCQLPDMLSELDAVTQSIVAMAIYTHDADSDRERWIRKYAADFPLGLENKHLGQVPQNYSTCLAVNRGLHCLNGHLAESEQHYRLNTARALASSSTSVELGLALHAFGDSFAHSSVKTGYLYKQVEGHGLVFGWQGLQSIENKGHSADNTCYDYDKKYAPYSLALYNLFLRHPLSNPRKRLPYLRPTSGIRMDFRECLSVETSLGHVAKQMNNNSKEEVQIPAVRDLIIRLQRRLYGTTFAIDEPDYDAHSASSLGLSGELTTALKKAFEWAGHSNTEQSDLKYWVDYISQYYDPEDYVGKKARKGASWSEASMPAPPAGVRRF